MCWRPAVAQAVGSNRVDTRGQAACVSHVFCWQQGGAAMPVGVCQGGEAARVCAAGALGAFLRHKEYRPSVETTGGGQPPVSCLMLHRVARGVLAGVRRGSEARGPHTQYGNSVAVSHSPGAQARRLLSTAETAVIAAAGAAQPFRWIGRGLVGLGLGSGAAAAALALTTPQPDGVDLDVAHVDLRPPTLGELVPRAVVLCVLFTPLLTLAPFAVAFPDRLRDVFFRLLTYTLAKAGPAFIKWGQVRTRTYARRLPLLSLLGCSRKAVLEPPCPVRLLSARRDVRPGAAVTF